MKSQLFRSVLQSDQPILGPALIIQFRTDGIQLSPAGSDFDAVLGNTPADQSALDPICSSLRECEIVNKVTSRRGVSVDVETNIGVILEPLGVAVEDCGIRRFIVVIPGEKEHLQVLIEGFFVWSEHRQWRTRPVIDPIRRVRRTSRYRLSKDSTATQQDKSCQNDAPVHGADPPLTTT